MIKFAKSENMTHSFLESLFLWGLGFSGLLDGIIEILTFGFISSNFKLESAKKLAQYRAKRDYK